MEYQPTNVAPTTRLLIPILAGVVVLLIGFSAALVAHDGLRNTIRSKVGLAIAKPLSVPDTSAENHDRQQLMEIAAVLGLVAVSDDLTSLVKTVVNDRNNLQVKNNDLNVKHSELNARHNDLAGKHADLNTKHGELDRQHKQLQVSNDELSKQHSLVKAEKAQFETRSKNAAKQFGHNLSSRLAKSTARQVASAPAESIPFVGISLIAAFTALDVYDACETMKALNELNRELGIEIKDNSSVCGVSVPTADQLRYTASQRWKESYASAADSLAAAGQSIPRSPPKIDWQQMRDQICPVVTLPGFCP